MNILFIHQNFPAQFKHLAPALAAQGHRVLALGLKKSTPDVPMAGVQILRYGVKRGSTPGVHPWISDLETKTIRAEACLQAAVELRQQGFMPDVIIAHPGWGESLFVKEVWPQARLGIYCEFYYQPHGSDVGFDPEFPVNDPLRDVARLRLKNINNLLHFEVADAGISPTHWQASTFPASFRDQITVVHDGIDTETLTPNSAVTLGVASNDGSQLQLSCQDEVITFVNRNLEPYRGYHTFMRALPELLRLRPQAHIMIVGGDGVSYGSKPPGGRTWRAICSAEVRSQISDEDWARVHFVGNLPYEHFVPLLQLSRVHVYLTYPFVLSWSLLEAMSIGCAIVASDTPPLKEAITHEQTGLLVDFFDPEALAQAIDRLAQNADERTRLGRNAREFAQKHYDLKSVCLPAQMEWVQRLADR